MLFWVLKGPHELRTLSNHTVEGRGHRVVIEGIDSSTFSPVTEESTDVTESTSSTSTLETETMDNKILTETTEFLRTTTLESDLLSTTTIFTTIAVCLLIQDITFSIVI